MSACETKKDFDGLDTRKHCVIGAKNPRLHPKSPSIDPKRTYEF